MFQSPSLRGSGRFHGRRMAGVAGRASFNPLHCGAVVASDRTLLCTYANHYVSIPFIAGQWSLRFRNASPALDAGGFQSPSLRGSGRFRSKWGGDYVITAEVSIPFIAGQWSLLVYYGIGRPPTRRRFQSPSLRGSGRFQLRKKLAKCEAEFQSPSLRGSGRFATHLPPSCGWGPRFNPLHCGAVVASTTSPRRASTSPRFQSPSLRGSGRFRSTPPPSGARRTGFNPLHCGAVVASWARR